MNNVVGAIYDDDIGAVYEAVKEKIVNVKRASTTHAKVPDGRVLEDDAWTLLHHAVLAGKNPSMVTLMTHYGADVNASSGRVFGFTPLHCCAITLDGAVAYHLLHMGADINAKNASNQTVVDMARQNPRGGQFVEYFEHESVPTAGGDAAVVAYVLDKMSATDRATLAHADDRTFLFLAWFVYRIVLKDGTARGAALDDAVMRQTLFRHKNSVGKIGTEALLEHTRSGADRIPMHLRVKRFVSNLSSLMRLAKTPRMVPQILEQVRKAAADVVASAPKKPPAMSKKTIASGLAKWTTMAYRDVQNAYRTNDTLTFGHAAMTNASLARYMRNYAPRAPEIVPGIERPTYLYRGMHGPLAAAVALDRGLKGWRGYLAFSRNYDISKKFGKKSPDAAETDVDRMGHVLFRLKLDDVPRGTPWIWYLTSGTNEAEMRRARNTAKAGLPEHEVLFPPGRLDFKSDFFEAVSKGIEKGIAAAAAGKQSPIASSQQHNRNNIFGTKKKTLKYDVPDSDPSAAARDLTIAMIRDLPMKNVRLGFSRKPTAFKKIAHMIQLALLDRGIVDYVIDRDMFRDPLEIDVVYVRDRNARSVAYSVPFSKQNNGSKQKQKQNAASVSIKKNNAAAANRNFFITTLK